jgi:hypothetical protein
MGKWVYDGIPGRSEAEAETTGNVARIWLIRWANTGGNVDSGV